MSKSFEAFVNNLKARLVRKIRPMEEPWIWTTLGNVPESSLLPREVVWSVHPDYIKMEYIYRDKAGVIVKHGADILSRKGVTGETIIGIVT